MRHFNRVIFVDRENTCRSIMAEAIFKSIRGSHELEVLSRGLVVLFPEPMNPKAIAVLKSNRLEVDREFSIPLSAEDLTADTLVLTMTEKEAVSVIEQFGNKADVSTVRAFTGQKGDVLEVHGALTEYGMLYEHMDLLVKMIAEILFKQEEKE